MRHPEVPGELSTRAFDFFFWFSRFESALKENQYLKSKKPGARAEPSWAAFVQRWENGYAASPAAQALLGLAPKTQVIGGAGNLEWSQTVAKPGTSILGQVVLMLRTVRNNLFHGGKHGEATWDDPKRVQDLLANAQRVLAELALLGGFEADFDRYY